MICWALCPDGCFDTASGKLLSVDLDHCKGCGICAQECPRHCIAMVPDERGRRLDG
jgi:pyruvate ferredoxin oxidoreductase delta subunit